MLNTSENYGGREEHRLATRSNILLDLAMDNDQLITLSSSNRRRRVFKAPSDFFVAEERTLEDLGPYRFYEPSKRLLGTPR
jgi:hypothetical protein